MVTRATPATVVALAIWVHVAPSSRQRVSGRRRPSGEDTVRIPLSAAELRRRTWSSNLQIEIALAGLASKVVLGVIATAGWPQISDHFIGYPATGTLEIVSTDRHETAKALQRVVRNMKPSFYLDLCGLDCRELTLKISKIVLRVHSQFRGYFDKLIGV